MTDAIANQKATEFFLRDVALELADINIVTDFSDIDQEIIVNTCRAIQLKNSDAMNKNNTHRDELIVVHNFKNSSLEDAEEEWKVLFSL